MVRRRSTVRFRKGAPSLGLFSNADLETSSRAGRASSARYLGERDERFPRSGSGLYRCRSTVAAWGNSWGKIDFGGFRKHELQDGEGRSRASWPARCGSEGWDVVRSLPSRARRARSHILVAVAGFTASAAARSAVPFGPWATRTTSARYCGRVTSSPAGARDRAATAMRARLAASIVMC